MDDDRRCTGLSSITIVEDKFIGRVPHAFKMSMTLLSSSNFYLGEIDLSCSRHSRYLVFCSLLAPLLLSIMCFSSFTKW